MAFLKLRDRDAIVTQEGIIMRVYGYSHPSNAYVCDPEYAPGRIYESRDSRAYREKGRQVYYKFYTDEGLRFVRRNYPQHVIWVKPLRRKLIGVHHENVWRTRQPHEALQSLFQKRPKDSLLKALHSLLDRVLRRSSLPMSDFGVFGSLLHDFYHPDFSDLDFIIYGDKELDRLRETLDILYREADSPLRNEFVDMKSVHDKQWKFLNYSPKEYLWHQRRKRIYGIFSPPQRGRAIKAEFEPVKRWNEIHNEYDHITSISQKGWIKLHAHITNAPDAGFMPSIYQIEPVMTLKGARPDNLQRVVSFVEEFRLQVEQDELVVVEGNLEQVSTPEESFQQVTLTHGPRYYEQTLKVRQSLLGKNQKV
ncbi:MAG TPA: nucleotidyltransferase domain-containing protein [Candidatus Bathyarchaeia archaeon]|nr:nucleotidyltransferase domain-containing protein [Candidatus Bathyarchaeia archaeon]